MNLKCDYCDIETETKSGQKYHYTGCGLDNVYLENIEVQICPKCNRSSPIIPRILELHNVIAHAIALKPAPLLGAEVRFLRKHLWVKAKAWAVYLHVDPTTLSRWENGEQKIGPQSDALIRLVYYRLLQEKQGQTVNESILSRVTSAVDAIPTGTPILSINSDNPQIYTYQTA